MRERELEFGVSIVGPVSDGASNMEGMCAQFGASTGRWTWKCQAHLLALCVTDLLKEKGRVAMLEKIVLVLKAFRASSRSRFVGTMQHYIPSHSNKCPTEKLAHECTILPC